ncbi:MAG: T9SS type A sorting domain-containing protein [Bacteroidia bacterium]
MRKLLIHIAILLLFQSLPALAQQFEIEEPLLENYIQKKYYIENPPSVSRSGPDTLSLPFLDDFSFSRVIPHDSLWADRYAFVNVNFGVNPPTIGVATLDGLKDNGQPYVSSFQTPEPYGVADYLTSKPFYMSGLSPADSVYLSFYYQPQGTGNEPLGKDSLVLEFFNPIDSIWVWAWSKAGSPSTAFQAAIIPITNPIFFNNGFRFRFKNYASLSCNCDHWNIDYVWLDKNRTANVTIMDDVAFVYEPNSLLNRYREMPWTQYKANALGEFNNSLQVTLRNNNSIPKNFTYSFNIYDRLGNLLSNKPPTNDNINALSNYTITNSTNLPGGAFPTTSGNSYETFLVENIISTAGDTVKTNDTLRTEIKFDRHFAYDDGSAEAVYGINVSGGKIAARYDLNTAEQITGIAIHFANFKGNVSNAPFRITIWKSLNPEEIIYQKDSVSYPVYEESVNGYHFYPIFNGPILNGTIYIGWVQVNNTNLRLGLDKNTSLSSKQYFNASGTWNETMIQGAWMFRPVFGGYPNLPISDEEINVNTNNLIIYPNPASNQLNVVGFNDYIQVQVFSMHGKLMLQQQLNESEKLDISSLSQGMYLIKIADNTGKIITHKLSVVR